MILEDIRNSYKLNQIDFAKSIGINSQSQYSDLIKAINNGKVLPIKYALNIAKQYNISLDTIYQIETTEDNTAKKINLLSESDKNVVLTLIDSLLSKK